MLKDLNRTFAGAQFRELITVQVDGRTVNSEKMLKTYLNAVEFHRDVDKVAEVRALQELLPSDAIRGIMVQLTVDKLNAIGNLEGLIAFLRGSQKYFEVQFVQPDGPDQTGAGGK